MQFDMAHCSVLATLWDPPFVLASVLWASLLACLLLEWRRTSRSMWKLGVLCTMATPFAVGSLAKLVAIPSGSCTLFGRMLWMAIPLAIPIAAAGWRQPRLDRIAASGRVIAVLTCLHARWTVTFFRDDIGQWTDLSRLVGFDERVAQAPWLAFLGAASVVLVYILIERGAQPDGWRRWVGVRLELLFALISLVTVIRTASLSTVYDGEPEPLMVTPVIILAIVFGAQAVLRHRRLSAKAVIGTA